jgi:hypothetical protein
LFETVNSAIAQAPGRLCDLIHHGDQGSQYASRSFTSLLSELSMSCRGNCCRGNCYDNAFVESFQSKRERKRVFRKMKRLVKVVEEHAQRYRDLLQAHWQETDWSHAQASQVIGRIDSIITKLPQAKKQAHERIINERQVDNENKRLSLYEEDIHVLVRGKAGAAVEFGNSVLLAEQPDGLIVDL